MTVFEIDINEFNKECAEYLGWESKNRHSEYLLCGKEHIDFLSGNVAWIKDMHFHDSYDWAYLLVHLICKKGINGRIVIANSLFHKFSCDWTSATPQQISQACLEVLK